MDMGLFVLSAIKANIIMKFFIVLFSFFLGFTISGFLSFNMFILPSYFGQYSMAVDNYKQLRNSDYENMKESLERIYLPEQSCYFKGIMSSVFIINKDVYENYIDKAFELIKIESDNKDTFCENLSNF